jgi:hypothetical protein
MEGFTATPGLSTTTGRANQGMLINISQPCQGGNLNLPQQFYQTIAYRPKMSLMGSSLPHGPVPDVLFPERQLPTHTS